MRTATGHDRSLVLGASTLIERANYRIHGRRILAVVGVRCNERMSQPNVFRLLTVGAIAGVGSGLSMVVGCGYSQAVSRNRRANDRIRVLFFKFSSVLARIPLLSVTPALW